MGFNYSYKPKPKSRTLQALNRHSRNIGLSLLAIALVFSFSLLSNSITGYVTYTSDLESTLNETVQQLNGESRLRAECSANLDVTKTDLAKCNDKLTSSQSYLVSCEKERGDLKAYSDKLNSIYSACDAERSDLKTKYANETENYKHLVRNTVGATCCSFGDSQKGVVRNWGIESNQIVCSGNFTVNCTTGNTNY